MADSEMIVFKHKEVAEALVKQRGLHEGIWGLFVRFGLKAANVGNNDADVLPTAIVPIIEFGIQRFDAENNLSVDAAAVNPRPVSDNRTERNSLRVRKLRKQQKKSK